MRGALEGVLKAEQDAALARVVRNHASGRLGVIVRANYVALPSVAGREREKDGEIRPDGSAQRAGIPHPEERSPDRKAAMTRRKAMRFADVAVAGCMREAKRYQLRLSARHAPRSLWGKTKSSTCASGAG